MRDRNVYLNIRVTNKDTNVSYEHKRVPLDHVETIKMNSNLEVEILGSSYGAYNNDRKRERKVS